MSDSWLSVCKHALHGLWDAAMQLKLLLDSKYELALGARVVPGIFEKLHCGGTNHSACSINR